MATGPGGCQCATDLGIANPQKTLQAGLDLEEEERIKKILAAQREKDNSMNAATYALFSSAGSDGSASDGGAGAASSGGGAAAP